MKVELTIRGEPASKANSRMLVKFGDRPAIIKSAKARDYERTALLQIPVAKRLMLEGRLKITIHIFYRSQRPDLDESVILDVLQARYKKGVLLREGVYKNDRAIHEKHIYHHIDADNPRAEIVVETLDEMTPRLFGTPDADLAEMEARGRPVRPAGRPRPVARVEALAGDPGLNS